jgi:hypothetical protein
MLCVIDYILFQMQEIQHTTLWADPGDVDLPNGNRCPYSLDTCRRFMAANEIDVLVRAHQVYRILFSLFFFLLM